MGITKLNLLSYREAERSDGPLFALSGLLQLVPNCGQRDKNCATRTCQSHVFPFLQPSSFRACAFLGCFPTGFPHSTQWLIWRSLNFLGTVTKPSRDELNKFGNHRNLWKVYEIALCLRFFDGNYLIVKHAILPTWEKPVTRTVIPDEYLMVLHFMIS